MHTCKRPTLDILPLHILSSLVLVVMNRRKGQHDSQLKVFLSGMQYSLLAEDVIVYVKCQKRYCWLLFCRINCH